MAVIRSSLIAIRGIVVKVKQLIVRVIISVIISLPKRKIPKSILLIRIDAIGDYILFRNFIKILKESEKYRGYKITLLGNNDWKTLAEELDGEIINDYIWIDRNKFNCNFLYKLKKIREIASRIYEVMISPVYSREFECGESIVKIVQADEKIGNTGDLLNLTVERKTISNKYYTKLMPARDDIIFEFYRNKEFFEKLIDTKLEIIKPSIQLNSKKTRFKLPKQYAVLFIGASTDFRAWGIYNFVKVAEYLKSQHYQIVLCGGYNDKGKAKEFQEGFQKDYIDLVGDTNLMELLYVINKSSLIVSNETSVPHLAAAMDVKKIFVIYNGSHFRRFTPYPKEICSEYHVVYHPEIEKDLVNYEKLSNTYRHRSQLNINEISYLSVIGKINSVLKMDSTGKCNFL